jgi:hypothetical protein
LILGYPRDDREKLVSDYAQHLINNDCHIVYITDDVAKLKSLSNFKEAKIKNMDEVMQSNKNSESLLIIEVLRTKWDGEDIISEKFLTYLTI